MGEVFLIPSPLHENGLDAIPSSVTDAILSCDTFFVENERTTRRYFKKLLPAIVIDNYEWIVISDENDQAFIKAMKENRNIGIISEAGCPGIADPGQSLVKHSQQYNYKVTALAGPSSILLALMASGMNGQSFRFHGYLPIDKHERKKAVLQMEAETLKNNCTQIFIETPYRNNQLVETIIHSAKENTRLCIAVDLGSPTGFTRTKTVSGWKNELPDLHKRPAIFLLSAE
jgi:16S rRNA (cytidine1402-2'-O)-methyltransferase